MQSNSIVSASRSSIPTIPDGWNFYGDYIRHRDLIVPAQFAYIVDKLDDDPDKCPPDSDDGPVELRLHDVVTGLCYWPIVTVRDLWALEHGVLEDYSADHALCFRWHDRRRWHPLKVGWWTSDDVLARLCGSWPTQRGGVNWLAARELDARDVLRRYPRSYLRRFLGRVYKPRDDAGTDTSGLVFKIVHTLVRHGATPTEAACVVMSSGAWAYRVDKIGLEDARRDVERIVKKAQRQ
jgi:hypothetical protein